MNDPIKDKALEIAARVAGPDNVVATAKGVEAYLRSTAGPKPLVPGGAGAFDGFEEQATGPAPDKVLVYGDTPPEPDPINWPCHKLPRDQQCDTSLPGYPGFMGHTCVQATDDVISAIDALTAPPSEDRLRQTMGEIDCVLAKGENAKGVHMSMAQGRDCVYAINCVLEDNRVDRQIAENHRQQVEDLESKLAQKNEDYVSACAQRALVVGRLAETEKVLQTTEQRARTLDALLQETFAHIDGPGMLHLTFGDEAMEAWKNTRAAVAKEVLAVPEEERVDPDKVRRALWAMAGRVMRAQQPRKRKRRARKGRRA